MKRQRAGEQTVWGKVELTLLRLAVYEMKHDDDIPQELAINEAG